MLGYNSLANIYKQLWQLSFHYKYSLEELENMMPYEKDIFIHFTIEELERQAEEKSKRNQ